MLLFITDLLKYISSIECSLGQLITAEIKQMAMVKINIYIVIKKIIIMLASSSIADFNPL
jgi:hypothetical protein